MDSITALTLQVAILRFAVEAIISIHPERDRVRQVFDQLYGQWQAQPSMLMVDASVTTAGKEIVEKLFSEFEEDQS